MYKIFENLLSARNLKAADVAKGTGISPTVFSDWKNGKSSPKQDKLQKIADYFNVTIKYLLGLEEDVPIPTKEGSLWIPVLGRVAAGVPISAVEDVIDYEEISPSMASSGEFFALQIKGNSMAPRIHENDVVIVKKQNNVENNEIAVVLINGQDATVKKFVKHENGISLISLNPAYDPMFFTIKEISDLPLLILGKVVELRAKFD